MLQARQQNIGGIWGLLFFDDPREYLQRLACYDRLFSEAQMTVPAALEIAECALKRCRPGTAIGQPAKTLEILECLYTAFPAATICSEDELQQRICGETIGKADVSAFLRQFASHGCVNQQHVEPLDPTDSHRYIFHRLPWGKYVLPPPPLSAHGAVLAIQDAMRTDGLSELGHEFEGAVRDLIGGQLKITVPSGKYVLDGVVYETDGFLNAGETLICLECKTKGLTDKARRGSITALIGDLWRSFLSSALQGLRLELAMRTASEQGTAFLVYSSTSEDKAILRHRAGPSWEVAPEEVRNARFVRLGVSLSEYGVFQQPAVVKNLLRIGMLYGFRMEEESAIATRFNETAVTSGKLQDVVLALLPHYEGASQDDRLQKLVHSSLFLSYDSLRSLVHASSSGKDFAGRLVRMLSVQPGAASLQSLRAMAALVHRGPADSRQVSDESDA